MAEAVAVEAGAPVADVADTLVALMRSFQRAKARYVTSTIQDVDWAGQVVLRLIAGSGPMRASEVAGCLHSDPSTVSRHVASMVKDGLLERRADPEDGRASILALTPKADAVIAEYERLRLTHFADMLSDWSERDLTRFAALLRRFTDDFENSIVKLHSVPSGTAEGNN
jgi:DNA-binding MarR family transcriptional regulator